ncbi:MAG: (Fe-S)-binding protein [Thermanaeromonas sp.]|uniref:(Fe-S)-binding protein n=1 Tax=Thermanaeromonas sp. TaxID=2003697 RepID=UPI00243D8490|nr:(Fe-S)-binding protein [Thermanaeromonas sp.]MCG0278802.1 (Fe-S)-binding protein [Thermanaeromonas sp.]
MELQEIRTALMRCVRCGQCRSVCPVFLAKRVESDSTRGRVTLIRALLEGEISFSKDLAEKVWQCLLCHSCSQECPSGVQVEKIIWAGRSKIAEFYGTPASKKILAQWILPNLRTLSKLMMLGRILQGLCGKEVSAGYWLPRFSLPMVSSRLLPKLHGQSLFQMVHGSVHSVRKTQGKVLFYTGCMTTYGFPSTGKAVIQVLNYNNFDVVIPPDQVCCGLPALSSGLGVTFNHLKQINLRVLTRERVDAIITACPSCGSTLKEYYSNELNVKVFDLSEFLVSIDFKPPEGEIPSIVTYHDPCHLRKAQKVIAPPRKILRSIPGIQFKEVTDPSCCGFGGTFALSYPNLSREIGSVKAKLLLDTGAETVITSCPGCMLQLADILFRRNSSVKVKHLAELLAESYSIGRPKAD